MKKLCFALALASLCACKDPEPFDVARVKGSELLAKSDFAGAATEYEKSLQLKPDQDAKVWDRAAFANMKAGNYDRAAELLEKSLERRPELAAKSDTLRNIAGMYLQQAKDSANAEKYFQKAAALDPKDEQALSWLAEISSQRGGARQQTAEPQPEHLKVALERYDAVIALNPAKADAYVNKRIVLVKYIEFLKKQKVSILADAESQKADKEAFADIQQQATDTQTRIDELMGQLETTTKKLGEVNKAAKAAK
ncbi:MAG: tetratricopeptide repeat protein [Archangium sp.]|nr:tetratricopeptide repeat protein [Archangium sp.]